MCGIVGALDLANQPLDPALVLRMRDVIAHRGPDDAGVWVDGAVGLGHRRLAILDLSPSGHQPMFGDDGNSVIVFNGEIFNFVELRTDLERAGHTFRSGSDTEVLLCMWSVYGPRMLDRLVGMFAFAIWDQAKRSLFAARDRTGIKPFYYTTVGNTFAFASEIKALLEMPGRRTRPDMAGLADVMFAGYTLRDRTVFEGVKVLPPAHTLEIRDGRVTVAPYWGVEFRYNRERGFEDTVQELKALLDNAVDIHCRSDAPIGAHLSGGLDSSAVAAVALRHRPRLDTFSIRFGEGGAFDESPFARLVAERIGSTHHESLPKADDLESLLAFLTYHVESPITPTAISYFSAARLARTHVTAALTGHGGDEVFGGYPAQFAVGFGVAGDPSRVPVAHAQQSMTQKLMYLLRSEGIGGVMSRVRGRARTTGRSGGARDPRDEWVARHCNFPLPTAHPALSAAARRSIGDYAPTADFLTEFDGAATSELFDRCLHHDLRSYLPSLLHVEDRMSMAVSLESRVPLLDHRLIDFMATVPPEIKSPQRRSKQLLRAAVADLLPDQVINRPDKGAFPVPLSDWLSGSRGDFARRILLEERTLDRGILDPRWVRASVADGGATFPWLAMELWFRVFVDRDPVMHQQIEQVSAGLNGLRGLAAK